MDTSELEYIECTAQVPLVCRVVSIENSSPHWHHEYEVFFVLRGAVTIHNEDGAWRLEAGGIILLNACEIHAINQPEKDNLCLVLQFNPAVFADIYPSSFTFELNTRSTEDIPDAALEIFRYDLAQIGLLMYERPNGYQFFIRSRLFDLIGALFKYLRYQVAAAIWQPDDRKLKDFDAVKIYIKQRFTEDINMEEMCRDLAMSRAKLYRILKDAGTESYKSLVNYYRVEHAKDLLRGTNLAIQYISTASGFESDSSFYRIFKELTSVSPNQYRVRPHLADAPVGVQGYSGYSMPQALKLLRLYCKRQDE